MAEAAAAGAIWFLDTLVRVRVSATEGNDGISILEHRVRHGDSPPLHRHETEDEIFHVLEGEFRFRIGETERRVGLGDIVVAPRGVPHTYRVESSAGGRWLTVTARGDFERFVRALGRPAERDELPPASGAPTPEAIAELTETAARFGIEVLGPPLD